MDTTELNQRSPLRVLEKSIHGGLGVGNIGVMVARHGIGKTAFLVDLAIDRLMRGEQVLHVSLQYDVEKVRAYHDEIFADLAHKRQLENVWQVRLDMERNRRIHSFLDGSFTVNRFRDVLAFKRNHTDFSPALIVMDGFGFEDADSEAMAGLRQIAAAIEAEMWMTATTHRDSEVGSNGIPEPVARLENNIDVVLRMAHDGSGVHISLLKDHDHAEPSNLKLALDPTTMLLIRE